MKSVQLSDDVHRRLSQYKLDVGVRSLSNAVARLLDERDDDSGWGGG